MINNKNKLLLIKCILIWILIFVPTIYYSNCSINYRGTAFFVADAHVNTDMCEVNEFVSLGETTEKKTSNRACYNIVGNVFYYLDDDMHTCTMELSRYDTDKNAKQTLLTDVFVKDYKFTAYYKYRDNLVCLFDLKSLHDNDGKLYFIVIFGSLPMVIFLLCRWDDTNPESRIVNGSRYGLVPSEEPANNNV